MLKKTIIGLLVVLLLIFAFFVYQIYLSPEAVAERVRRTNDWMQCRADFRDQYQKAGGNPYTLDGQKAMDKYCGEKP